MKIYNLSELKSEQIVTYLKQLRADVQTTGLELKKIISKIEKNLLINTEYSFALVVENEIGGIIFILESVDAAYISLLYISAKFRNRGFGRSLMERALDGLRQADIKEVYLEVLADNQYAIKLYQSMGFEIVRQLCQFRNETNSFYRRDSYRRYENGDPLIFAMLRKNFGVNKLFSETNPLYINFLLEAKIAEFHIFYLDNKICGYIIARRGSNSLDIIDYGIISGSNDELFIMISHILLKETVVVIKNVVEDDEILNDLKKNGFFLDIKQYCMKLIL